MTDQELENLLPWYVNGTLSENEREAVEAYLNRSEHAREQLAFLRQLSEQIQQNPPARAPEMEWRRFQRSMRKTGRDRKRDWWKPGLALAASLILALQVAIFMHAPNTVSETHLLSQGTVTSTLKGTYWQIQIEFREDSSWQEIRSLVKRVHGTIIDGPSTIGLLRVAVPVNNGEYPSPEALLSWLRQQSPVVHAALES